MILLLAAAMAQTTVVESAPVSDGPPEILKPYLSLYVMCRDAEVSTLSPRPATFEEWRGAYSAAGATCRPVREIAVGQADRALSHDNKFRDEQGRRAIIADWFETMDHVCNYCSVDAQGRTEPQRERR